MKFERTYNINLTAEECDTLIKAGDLLDRMYDGMQEGEYVFDDFDDCEIKDLADSLKAAGVTGTIGITKK